MDQAKPSGSNGNTAIRVLVAFLLCGLVVAYTAGVIAGGIPQDQQINAVHLGIIALAAVVIVLLFRPQSLARLKLLEMSGFKLEMLERVKEKQTEQANLLEDISLILPLLLPETERKHLFNMDSSATSGYKGSSALRRELRRLRSIGLLQMQPNRHVAQMASGTEFDLADYVGLTDLGKRWVRRIKQIEKGEAVNNDADS